MKKQVLVADDHAIIRDGMRKILADTDDMEMVGEAANGHEVMDLIRQRDWDLVVLDLSMPGRSGVELIKLIKAERPKCPILIFSMHPEEQYALRALRAGASGYLSKEGDSDLILPALRKVASGGVYISTNVAELLASDVTPHFQEAPHKKLSDREFQVFDRIVQGVSLTDIAHELSLSIKTVSTHKSHILNKMNMRSHVDLLRYALEHHLLEARNL
ncbi:MAG: DNA-binding response regulator [Betaproteobacteria bacterium]|jgi:DNA-binding NarL/FixJ family response regulator|nr:DNA-binding response regulator [Betaproteobacteria bacterium]NBX90168.1 DNA-binding response regulator [Betaproteobacteria bacterium]